MSASKNQLLLLDVPLFTAGPARVRRARAQPRAVTASLDLPFTRPSDGDSRGIGFHNAVARRIRKSPPPESVGPPEERLLVGGRPRGASERTRLEQAFEAGVGDCRRRRHALLLKKDSDWLELHVDKEVVRVLFSGRAALNRWFPAIRDVGAEHGLVEPE